jgi:hypothetical protein
MYITNTTVIIVGIHYTKTFDKTTTKYEHFLILGDLNYDMLVNEKCTALKLA